MPAINIDTRQSIYFGVHFIVASNWTPDPKQFLAYQQELLKETLEFSETTVGPRSLSLLRKEQSPFQVKLASLGPQVAEIRIATPTRAIHTLDPFCEEAEAVCRAYAQVWLNVPCQILTADATIRHLYSCDCHAFQYLWENRLEQEGSDFHKYLGRPVLGGGLRLVLPGTQQSRENIEVKIESYLEEQTKIYLETVFAWPTSRVAGKAEEFGPTELLRSVEKYATNEVCDFLLKREKEDKNGSNA
jgi:hypothetical protein